MFRKSFLAGLALGVALAAGSSASAAEHPAKELNNGPAGMMTFDPLALKLKVGEAVHFQPTDMGHTVDSVPGMLPNGAAEIHAGMGKDAVITFTKPGVYGIRCTPHYGMGMVMVVEVGAPTNLAEAKAAADKSPPMAKKRFAEAFAKLGL